jgi:hypothetical protein
MTHWEVARSVKTQGVLVSISIDPKLVSPRIRSKLLRWLQCGVLEGGYRSEARKLAALLLRAFDLEVSSHYWNGLRIVDSSPELREELVDIRIADWAAFVLEQPKAQRTGSYYQNKMTNDLAALKTLNGLVNITLSFETKELRRAAVQAVKKHLSEARRQQLQRVIDALMGDQLISIREV